jgi:hypothetical protein
MEHFLTIPNVKRLGGKAVREINGSDTEQRLSAAKGAVRVIIAGRYNRDSNSELNR